MQDHGPARGTARARAAAIDYTLGRGEIQAAGITAAELPMFRDWCRQRLPPTYYRIVVPITRTGALLEHAELYAKELATVSPERAKRLENSIQAARQQHTTAMKLLERHRLKALPALPDPRDLGAVPTTPEEEFEERGRAAASRSTWNPAWGDPDAELPAPRPQGMRALPTQDVPIPPRGRGRPRLSDPAPRKEPREPQPPSTQKPAVDHRQRRAQAKAQREQRAEPPGPRGPAKGTGQPPSSPH